MGSFALLNEFTYLPYWPCYLIALCLSVLWNFTLNRKFTFQSAANVPVAMAKVNMLLNFSTEFLYQRFFVFGKSLDSAKQA